MPVYKACIATNGRESYIEEFEGNASSAQEFHKNIFTGEDLIGQYNDKPNKYIKEIKDSDGTVVYDHRSGFITN